MVSSCSTITADRTHDAAVIDRLREADRQVAGALAPLSEPIPRFDLYTTRLRRALERIEGGDHAMIAARI